MEAFEVVSGSLDRNQADPAAPLTAPTAGKIEAIEDSLNQFLRHDIRRTERTATARTGAEASHGEDAFSGTSGSMDRNQVTAAPLTSGQSAGMIERTEDALNQFLRHDIRRTRETAKAVSGAENDAATGYLVSSSGSLDRNQTAPATLPSGETPGTIQQVNDTLNQFLRHDIRRITQTAHYRLASGTFSTLNGTHSFWNGQHAESSDFTSILAGASMASGYGGVSLAWDNFQRLSFNINKHIPNSTIIIPGWELSTEETTQYIIDFIQAPDGTWYKRKATITLTYGTHGGKGTAKTAADGGYSYAHFKSGFGALANGQYWSIKVGEPSFTYSTFSFS